MSDTSAAADSPPPRSAHAEFRSCARSAQLLNNGTSGPGGGKGFLEGAAFLDAASYGARALGRLLDDEGGVADGTRLRDRLIPARELAGGVTVAAVEDLAAPRALLEDLALATIRASDAEALRLD